MKSTLNATYEHMIEVQYRVPWKMTQK